MKGLDVGYGVLCHPFDLRRAGSINNSTGVDGVAGVKSCAKRNRNFYQLLLPLANQNDVRFAASSRHRQRARRCPKSANSGHSATA
jgi:hypothetical protein